MKNKKGFSYIETLMALGFVAIIGTSLIPLYLQMLSSTTDLKNFTKLTELTNYVGNYLFRWASFDPLSKPIPLEAYIDGQELEISGEKRINKLRWAEPLTSLTNIPDQFKASITFWETTPRNGSAVVKVILWYDQNLNNLLETNEQSFNFSTIVTEKMNP